MLIILQWSCGHFHVNVNVNALNVVLSQKMVEDGGKGKLKHVKVLGWLGIVSSELPVPGLTCDQATLCAQAERHVPSQPSSRPLFRYLSHHALTIPTTLLSSHLRCFHLSPPLYHPSDDTYDLPAQPDTMELNPPRHEHPPPEYISHDPADLTLPSVPKTELSSPHVQAEITLPDLRTVLSPQFEHQQQQPPRYAASSAPHDSPRSMRSLPPIDPGSYAPRKSIEQAVMSPSEAGSAMSVDERSGRSTSAVSMDDADVRIAASALAELGNPGMESIQ